MDALSRSHGRQSAHLYLVQRLRCDRDIHEHLLHSLKKDSLYSFPSESKQIWSSLAVSSEHKKNQ